MKPEFDPDTFARGRLHAGPPLYLLPGAEPLFPPQAWAALLAFVAAVTIVVPVLFVVVPEGSAFHLSAYFVTLVGKIMCYCAVALAMNLIWGYTGILSLGHGLFFALGGYGFGMYLMRMIGREGQYQSDLPDFMVFLDWKAYPWYWSFTEHFWYAVLLVVLVPGLLAFVFGYFAFRSRIKGVYFSIITQALTFAFMLLFFRNDTGFGGNNGFTDFKRILGWRIAEPGTRAALFAITGLYLASVIVLSRAVVRSKLGRVLTAIRDSETRLMFSGYNPLWYKLSIWTLSAALCGIAGALYVPQVGIINPSEMSPANSIEIAIWVAVGGRGTLLGPVLGAGLVNGAKSFFTQAYPEYWLFILGLLFVLVTLFLPRGVIGVASMLRTTPSPAAPPLLGKLGKEGSTTPSPSATPHRPVPSGHPSSTRRGVQEGRTTLSPSAPLHRPDAPGDSASTTRAVPPPSAPAQVPGLGPGAGVGGVQPVPAAKEQS